jgi:pyridoxamine 5'-phosphate oxidase
MDGLELDKDCDPIALFQVWMEDAETKELNDPNAVALATASRDGMPSVRMVLVKRVDERGFAFYTNAESQKGLELAENPRAAMCFHWKSLRRQVRVSGAVILLSDEDADAYFHSRSRLSQVGAAASAQSRVLESREMLEMKVRELQSQYAGEIPRPDYWRGYLLQPEKIEFWQDGAGRLHDRFLFTRMDGGWRVDRLFP